MKEKENICFSVLVLIFQNYWLSHCKCIFLFSYIYRNILAAKIIDQCMLACTWNIHVIFIEEKQREEKFLNRSHCNVLLLHCESLLIRYFAARQLKRLKSRRANINHLILMSFSSFLKKRFLHFSHNCSCRKTFTFLAIFFILFLYI